MKHEILSDGIEIYCGDCREILPTLGKVDAVVTDPPYELSDAGPGKSHFGMSLNKFDGEDYKKIVAGFDCDEIFSAIARVCSPFNIFCFCSNKQISEIMSYHELRGRSTTLLVWHKTNAAPFANGVWRGDIEYCVHARDSGAVFIGNAEEKKKVTEFPLVIDDAHPTVKPLALLTKYIRICSRADQTILDPFMGSGTTGVAAVKLGRKFIGIEIEPKYYEIAKKRITDALKQPDFFVEKPKPAKQESMFAEKHARG